VPVSAGAGFLPGECPGARQRGGHVEAQRVRRSGGHPAGALGLGHRFRIAGIERRAIRIARPRGLRFPFRDQARDLGAAFKAGIDEPHGVELGERGAVIAIVLGLPPHRLFPGDAEPGQVLVNCRLEFGPAARRVDVLDAQQQPPARRLRPLGIEQGRQRMAEMQIAVGRRREAENGWQNS
jgi:hypothetical protein